MLMRLDPIAQAGQLRREFDRLFNGLVRGADVPGADRRSFPALNVWEDGDHIYAEAEVPGIALEDLEIQVVGNQLTVQGERKPAVSADTNYHRRERGVGKFLRSLELPAPVDAEQVEAVLHNGVLSITLPKSAPARARKITVQAK